MIKPGTAVRTVAQNTTNIYGVLELYHPNGIAARVIGLDGTVHDVEAKSLVPLGLGALYGTDLEQAEIIKKFIEARGQFPVGSAVRTIDSHVGVVVGVNLILGAHPYVLLYTGEPRMVTGLPYEDIDSVSLSELNETEQEHVKRIRRAIGTDPDMD